MPRAKRQFVLPTPPEPPPEPKAHPLIHAFSDPQKYHQIAKCRWCGGRFTFVFGEQWVCETFACAERQIANALKKAVPLPGESPFMFLPLPLQVEIEDSPIKRLAVWGPVGISKSYGLRMHVYARCRKIPGYRALLLRATSDQLYKNHLQFMHGEALQLGDAEFKMGGGKIPPQMGFTDIDSIVFMGHLQDRGDIAQHMGPEWDEVDVDEANHVITDGLQKVTSRDRGSKPSYRARMAMGLDQGRTRLLLNVGGISWPYIQEFYIDKTPDRHEYEEYDPQHYGAITGNLEDNPYLTAEMRTSVLGGLDAATRRQFTYGDRTAIPGQFFTQFDKSVHVIGGEQ